MLTKPLFGASELFVITGTFNELIFRIQQNVCDG